MKLKKEIVLGNIDGNDFAVATGKLSKKVHGLMNNNKTAAYIFELLKKEQTEDSIVDAMCEKYDAPREVIAADVHELIKKLDELGILD
ncbi:MAG: PqqD family protein [Eubacterium sp.]|nr:PqqD family protein [Eubacterium sp.]MBQ8980279.1 PqqD family protein [Eubacterium sp.]MBR1532235.1 PqqD family protein [Eubacterium sp.]MBR2278744.1 PqqD family protein [Eubacterium sp.]